MVLWSIVLLLATLVGTLVTMIVSLLLYIVAHSLSFAVWYTEFVQKKGFGILHVLYAIFPNFSALSIKDSIDFYVQFDYSAATFLPVIGMHIVYSVICVILAVLRFRRWSV